MILEINIVGMVKDVKTGREEEIKLHTGLIGTAVDAIVNGAMVDFVREAIQNGKLPVKITSIACKLDSNDIRPYACADRLKQVFPELDFS